MAITIDIQRDGSTVKTITVTDAQERCMLNDLLSFEEWIESAVKGKVNNCQKRLFAEWLPRLDDDPNVTTIPADKDLRAVLITSRPDYKNRAERESEGATLQRGAAGTA